MRTLLHERFHLAQNRLARGLKDPLMRDAFPRHELARIGAALIAQRLGTELDEIWHGVPA